MFVFRIRQAPIVRSQSVATRVVRPAAEKDAIEIVWSLLLKHQDRFSHGTSVDSSGAVVSDLRQEAIAVATGIPLHLVIRAIRQLEAEGRLDVVGQGAGRPNRYILRAA